MWNNCTNVVNRLCVRRWACDFVEAPCFALLCLLTVGWGAQVDVWLARAIACELRRITLSFIRMFHLFGAARWEACFYRG